MATYQATGIILRRTNYGEADRILTFLTAQHGKVSAIAKSVRKSGAKLAGHLEPFGEVQLRFAEGRGELDVVTGARLQIRRDQIAQDYEAMRRGFLFCEMVDKLLESGQESEVYDLLNEALDGLNRKLEPQLVELYFKLNLLKVLGHQPDLLKTVDSKEQIQERNNYFFNISEGGLTTEQTPLEFPDQAIKLWRLMLKMPLKEITKIGGTVETVEATLPICNRFLEYHFDKKFKSESL